MRSKSLTDRAGALARRRIVVWLLALVLPLQGLAATLVQVRGPAHVHARSEARTVLVDFRRPPSLAHVHAHGVAHHHHGADDASVTFVDGDRFGDAQPHDAGTAGDAAGAFLPLPAEAVRWLGAAIGHLRRAGPAWTPTTTDPTRLERPPRSARA